MKFITLIMSFVISANLSAQLPVTPGTYYGKDGNEKCVVVFDAQGDSVGVSVSTASNRDTYAIANFSKDVVVNENTGDLSSKQSLKFPHFLKGGTQVLNVRFLDASQVDFSISKILVDHKGNDFSTFVSCTVSL